MTKKKYGIESSLFSTVCLNFFQFFTLFFVLKSGFCSFVTNVWYWFWWPWQIASLKLKWLINSNCFGCHTQRVNQKSAFFIHSHRINWLEQLNWTEQKNVQIRSSFLFVYSVRLTARLCFWCCFCYKIVLDLTIAIPIIYIANLSTLLYS